MRDQYRLALVAEPLLCRQPVGRQRQHAQDLAFYIEVGDTVEEKEAQLYPLTGLIAGRPGDTRHRRNGQPGRFPASTTHRSIQADANTRLVIRLVTSLRQFSPVLANYPIIPWE